MNKSLSILYFIFGPILLLSLFLIQTFQNNIFSTIIREDNFIEYSQFFVLMIAGLFAVLASIKLRHRWRFLAGLYLLFGLTLIFVGLEEISWGQRLLGIETPEYIADINVQQETTVHNLYFLHNLVGYGYMIIGLYGSVAWLLLSPFKKSLPKLFPWIVSPWYLAPYFFTSFFYNLIGHFVPINQIWSWAEISELTLHLGLFIFFAQRYASLLKQKL